ncbi:hypothetical protein AgCh_023192 [Apium graveolens]
MVVLARKIKLVKQALKELNKSHGDLNDNVASARANLNDIQEKLEHFLLQKSRVKWMDKGDGNNSFSFNQCKKNWNVSKVLTLEGDTGLVHGQANYARVAVSYFSDFLGKASLCTEKGGAKISWTTVCLPKEEGGLGVKNMVDWNRAQIIGHLLKVVTKSSSLYSTWVNATLLRNKHFWTMKIPPDSSWIWKKVLKLRNIAL